MLAAATSFVDLRCRRAKLIAFVLRSVLVPICLLAYVIWQGALAAFDDVILFTAARYASIQSTPFGYSRTIRIGLSNTCFHSSRC
jgi:hypothetical protein